MSFADTEAVCLDLGMCLPRSVLVVTRTATCVYESLCVACAPLRVRGALTGRDVAGLKVLAVAQHMASQGSPPGPKPTLLVADVLVHTQFHLESRSRHHIEGREARQVPAWLGTFARGCAKSGHGDQSQKVVAHQRL